MTDPRSRYGLVVESLHTSPWTSLTFTGDRHRLVVRLPAGFAERTIDADALHLPACLIAIERAAWSTTHDGVVLSLDVLAIGMEK